MVLFVPTSWRKRAFSRSNSAAAAAWWAACLLWARAAGPEASLERSRESAAFRSAPAVSIGSDRVCMKFKWNRRPLEHRQSDRKNRSQFCCWLQSAPGCLCQTAGRGFTSTT
jgi:hypothetical protein